MALSLSSQLSAPQPHSPTAPQPLLTDINLAPLALWQPTHSARAPHPHPPHSHSSQALLSTRHLLMRTSIPRTPIPPRVHQSSRVIIMHDGTVRVCARARTHAHSHGHARPPDRSEKRGRWGPMATGASSPSIITVHHHLPSDLAPTRPVYTPRQPTRPVRLARSKTVRCRTSAVGSEDA